MTELNRRRFLKGSGMAAAVCSLPVTSVFAADAPKTWTETVDVIVVGAGGAGLAAAATAGKAGVKTLVLEKMAFPGGNTIISGGGFNAADPEQIKALNKEDSPALHARQTIAAGDYRGNPELVKTLAEGAPKAIEWLKSLGVEFNAGVYQIYGGLWPRAHTPVKPAGQGYIEALLKACKASGVTVQTNTKVTSLIREKQLEGRVIGVEAEVKGKKVYYRSLKGVVVTSGGFSANKNLRSLYDPRMKELTTTNQPGSTGDLVNPLIDIGAQMVGMDYIQCIPGKVPGQKGVSSGWINRVAGFVFVNEAGERFIAEDQRRDVLRDAVLAQPNKVAFPVLDSKGFAALPAGPKAKAQRCLDLGESYQAQTIEELARKMGVPEANLVRTIQRYNEAVKTTKRDDFGRGEAVLTDAIDKPPFYAGRISMSVHHTMGGVCIDKNARCIDRRGAVIPGLYAAGEVTGGIHGTNRVGGNAIADIFVFGRIAGDSASKGL